jgi:hypothetical protein
MQQLRPISSTSPAPETREVHDGTGGRRGAVAARMVVIALVYLGLAVLLTLNTWLSPQHTLVGTGSDPVSGSWAIGWVPYAIAHGVNPLFSDHLNSPAGINLLWNNSVGVPLLLLWPITTAWGPFLTFNIAMTCGVAAAAFTACLAARRYVRGFIVPAFAGLLYGFSPFMMGQLLGHDDIIVSAITPPLALLLVDELLVRQRLRTLTFSLLTAGLALLQYFLWAETLITEVMCALVLIAILAVAYRHEIRRRIRYTVHTAFYALVASLLALSLPLAFQLFGPSRVQYITQPRGVFVSDLVNFVVPTPVQLVAPTAAAHVTSRFTGNVEEWGAYVGIPLLLLMTFGLVWLRRVVLLRVVAVFAVVIAVLSLGPHLHVAGIDTGMALPWWTLNDITVLDDILPARFMLYVFLALGIGSAFILQSIARRRRWTAVATAAVVVVSLLPAAPILSEAVNAPPGLSNASVRHLVDGKVVLMLPWSNGAYPSAMAWQAESGYSFRMTDGYFVGAASPGSDDLHANINRLLSDTNVSSADRVRVMQLLRALRIDAVVVGPGPDAASNRHLMQQLLGAPAYHDADIDVWHVA